MRNAKYIATALLFVLFGAAGCSHSPTPEEKQSVDDMRTIIADYIVAQNRLGHPPASAEEIRQIFGPSSSDKGLKLLDNGQYVIIWNTPFDLNGKNLSTTVLAFPKTAYTNGGMVQMLSGVDTPYMAADALKAAVKQNPAWDPALLEAKPAAQNQ